MSQFCESLTCTNSSDYIPATIGGNNNNYIVVDGNTIRITKPRTITHGNEPGYIGEICYDQNYIYVCVGPNEWRKSPLQGF